MKKVLIITYYFPPLNAVAGQRAWSWAKHLSKFGVKPVVVTRHWTGKESNWSDLTQDYGAETTHEVFDEYEVYRLSSQKMKLIVLLGNNLLRSKLFSKPFYFLVNLFGHFNMEGDARSSFSDFIFRHLKENKYDVVIITSPPLNLIRLASEIHQQTGIKVHMDLRDLWNNSYLKKDHVSPFSQWVLDKIKIYYIKKWLKNASGMSTVSEPIAEVLKDLRGSNENTLIMTNGFDEELYKGVQKKRSEQFRFSLVGSYYIQQDFSLLISGLNKFLEDKTPAEFQINLVGVSAHSDVAKLLHENLPSGFIRSQDRVSHEEAVNCMVNSEVLYHSGWKGYKGIYTTKLFDFLASGNKLLVAPGDDDVMDEIVNRLNAGKVVNTEEEFVATMNEWFGEWKKTGMIASSLDRERLQSYSRHSTTQQFASFIRQHY